jgi:hypothetical protein
MKKVFAIFAIFFFVTCGVLPAIQFAFAEEASPIGLLQKNLEGVGGGLGDKSTGSTLPVVIGKIIKVVVGVLGIVLTALIVYGGYLCMTAGGDQGQVKKAKDYITNGVIGLIICILAYAITNFVVAKIGAAVAGG